MQMAFNFSKSFFVHMCFDSFMMGEFLLKNKEYLLFWIVHEGIAQALVFVGIKKILRAE